MAEASPTQISFTFAELRALWLSAGGSAQWADTMAAIALAESNGCRYALAGPRDIRPVKTCTYRATTAENSFGLWQINRNAHPQYDEFGLFDPTYNARAAVAVLGHGTPTPWSTYTNGSYRTYLPKPGGIPGSVGPHSTPKSTPPAKHATTKLHLPESVTPPGQYAPRTGNVLHNWKYLTHAVGAVLPGNDVHIRAVVHRLAPSLHTRKV